MPVPDGRVAGIFINVELDTLYHQALQPLLNRLKRQEEPLFVSCEWGYFYVKAEWYQGHYPGQMFFSVTGQFASWVEAGYPQKLEELARKWWKNAVGAKEVLEAIIEAASGGSKYSIQIGPGASGIAVGSGIRQVIVK